MDPTDGYRDVGMALTVRINGSQGGDGIALGKRVLSELPV
jgi:hypothetical protein